MKSVSIADIGGGWYLVTFRDRSTGREWQRVYRRGAALAAKKAFLRKPA